MGTSIVLGQGLSGSALAWQLHWQGVRVEIVDRGSPVTASRVAAGLITPVTGRRLTKSEDFDQDLAFAQQFYQRVESEVGETLLDHQPAARFFVDDAETAFFLTERLASLHDDVVPICDESEAGTTIGFWMQHAARLRVLRYLDLTREYFAARGQYHQADIDLSEIHLQSGEVRMDRPALSATHLYFCQGYQAQQNPWFPDITNAPARGEILTVRIPSRTARHVVHQGHWIAPLDLGGGTESSRDFIVGATYDRENLTALTTEAGKSELLAAARQFASSSDEMSPEILGHTSAVRAGTRQRRPVMMRHPEHPQLAILNGMGSKASLWAPMSAKRLLEMMAQSEALPASKPRSKSKSLTTLAHSIVRRAIAAGDLAIDATAGNGHDTLFLAQCVGEGGRVTSIDVQLSAIESTRARLEANAIINVQLLHGDHGQHLRRMADEHQQAKAIMFNLGYLPGGDKQQTTTPDSTIMAIRAGLHILSNGGVMTVTAYRGHPGGQQEAAAVAELAKSLPDASITVDVIPGSEDNNESPVLFVFRR